MVYWRHATGEREERMKRIIRWGILGAGAVSRKFARDLRAAAGAELVAVGSRSAERAERLASALGARRAHASYGELVRDAEIDAVYVGTPHSLHRDHTLLCLRHGKHVLCEKPFALNAGEAAEMIRTARERRLALMEAMWMRFFPSMQKVRELIAGRAIGAIRRITADFGFRAAFDPAHRLFDRSLGGGALLDIGIYGLSLARMLLGEPADINGAALMGETGVDEESVVILGYDGGATAVLTASLRRDTRCEALVLGTGGSIRIPAPWWASSRIMLTGDEGTGSMLALPFKGNGFAHEAEAFMDCIRAGALENDIMPLDETLSIMRTMDAIRRRWGLRYPSEEEHA